MMPAVFGACQVGPVPFGNGYSTVFGNYNVVMGIPSSLPAGPCGSVSFGDVPVVVVVGSTYGTSRGVIAIIVPTGYAISTSYGDLFPSNLLVSVGVVSMVSFGQVSMVTPSWHRLFAVVGIPFFPDGVAESLAFGSPVVVSHRVVSGFTETTLYGSVTGVIHNGVAESLVFGSPIIISQRVISGFVETLSYGSVTAVIPSGISQHIFDKLIIQISVSGFAEVQVCGAAELGAAGTLILSESFPNMSLASRGWSANVTACTSVYDATLGHNVCKCDFTAGKDDPGPNPGGSYSDITMAQPLEEFTIKYKAKITSAYAWDTLHSFYMMSDKGGTPANSWGTFYFDPSTTASGEYDIAFQDNQSTNCSYGNVDLTDVTEDRTVGGYQQFQQMDSNVAHWFWGTLCTGSYTGQTGITITPQTSHPVSLGEWFDVSAYIKMNTPGLFDGLGWMSIKRPSDTNPVVIFNNQRLMFRANGWNSDLKSDICIFGPYASGNTKTFTLYLADLQVYQGDGR